MPSESEDDISSQKQRKEMIDVEKRTRKSLQRRDGKKSKSPKEFLVENNEKADKSKPCSDVAEPQEKKKQVGGCETCCGGLTSSPPLSDLPVKCRKNVQPEKNKVRPQNKAHDDLTYEAIVCHQIRKEMWLLETELLFMTRVLRRRLR